jgi:hypothetical protein
MADNFPNVEMGTYRCKTLSELKQKKPIPSQTSENRQREQIFKEARETWYLLNRRKTMQII